MALRVVEYSKYSLAVFGDSRAIKDELKAIGGKFNPYLKQEGVKTAGWIVPIKNKAEVDKVIGGGTTTTTPATLPATTDSPKKRKSTKAKEVDSDGASSPNEKKAMKKRKTDSPPTQTTASVKAAKSLLRVVEYSTYSLAVFGDSRAIKDQLKAIGGKFNPYLKQEGVKTAGWIIPVKNKAALTELLSADTNDGDTSDGDTSDGSGTAADANQDDTEAKSDSDDEPITLKPKTKSTEDEKLEGPSKKDIKDAVFKIAGSIEEPTRRMVFDALQEKFPKYDIKSNKEYLKQCIADYVEEETTPKKKKYKKKPKKPEAEQASNEE